MWGLGDIAIKLPGVSGWMWLAQYVEPAHTPLSRCVSCSRGSDVADSFWSVHFEVSGQCSRKRQGGEHSREVLQNVAWGGDWVDQDKRTVSWWRSVNFSSVRDIQIQKKTEWEKKVLECLSEEEAIAHRSSWSPGPFHRKI